MRIKGLKYHSLAGDWGVDRLMNPAGYVETPDMDLADIIIFNGGEDIGTELYGEKPCVARVPYNMSERDKRERSIFDKYKSDLKHDVTGKFFFGICRGAQFLNVMNEGSLWQHVDGHHNDHDIYDLESGQTLKATSTHHQMMFPNLEDGVLVATASKSTYKHRDGEHVIINPKTEPDLDAEIMWYPRFRSLCIQGHPEYVPGSQFADYCLKLLSKFYYEKVAQVA